MVKINIYSFKESMEKNNKGLKKNEIERQKHGKLSRKYEKRGGKGTESVDGRLWEDGFLFKSYAIFCVFI